MASTSFRPQLLAACTLLLALLICSLPVARAQNNCSAQLTYLGECKPYVVPGAPGPPSSTCCSVIASGSQDCLCIILSILTRLPSQCSLPAFHCGA